jgi:DNA polymerase III sliding clamp (beta) subunit (PCNA family)
MKFSVKNSDVTRGLSAALSCSNTGVKREYPDAGRITIEATSDGLRSFSHNGNVALMNTQSGGESYKFETAGSLTVKTDDFVNSINSYAADETLTFSLENNELIIRPSDVEQLQSIPIEVRQIVMPDLSKKFDKEISIKRDIFAACMSKVTFSMGVEKYHPEFLYWVMRIGGGKIRSVGGDGALIAVYELEGDSICEGKKVIDVAIHKDHNPIIDKIIPLCGDDSILFKEYSRSNDDDPLMNQTIISAGNISMMLIGHNPQIKWPDENRFLSKERNYRFTLRTKELAIAVKGNYATFNQDVRKTSEVHSVAISFDLKKKTVSLTASGTMRSLRKATLVDCSGPSDKVEFKCVSRYLNETINNADADGYVQIELPGPLGPAYIRYFADEKITNDSVLARSNNDGTKEQYTVFFAGYNKK